MSTREEIYDTEPQLLAHLMLTGSERNVAWHERDFAEMLRHQLAAPLLFDLNNLGEKSQLGQQLQSFGDLFHHPSPPVELLKLTKDFAKFSDARSEQPLPSEIASVLYLSAIVVAKLRLNMSISSLTTMELEEGMRWVLGQDWVDSRIRSLFEQASHEFDFSCID